MDPFATPKDFPILAAPSLKEKKRRRAEKCAPFCFPPSVRRNTVAQRRRTEEHRHLEGARARANAPIGPLLRRLKRRASEIKVGTERRAGELLREGKTERANGVANLRHSSVSKDATPTRPTLAEMGITRDESRVGNKSLRFPTSTSRQHW